MARSAGRSGFHRMVFNEQGQCTEFQAVGRDITPLKQAEPSASKHSAAQLSQY